MRAAVFHRVGERLTIEEVPACPEDLNGNGEVEFGDLLQVLTAWGPGS